VAEVVITAPRLPDPAGNAAYSIVTVGQDALADRVELDQALKSVAGFSLYRRTSTLGANPTTQGVSLRAIAGSGASRALVTLDGAPQNDPFGGWVIWTALPSATIGRAEIVRGAGAGPYGAGALTGVVSLDSRANLDGVEGEASAGSLGYRQGLAVVGGKVAGAQVLADVSAQHSDGWIPVEAGRGAADRPLSLDAYSGAVRAEERVGTATVAARVAAYDENRGAGQVSAGSRAKGVQASVTAAAQPGPDALGWRLQGWVSGSDLYNASASLAAGRNTSTPANVQYATPALGWGANAAVRKLAGDITLELGADVRGATGEDRERFTYSAGDFTKKRKAGGETLVAGLYGEASDVIGAWTLTGGVRADYWSTTSAERVEQSIATGATTLNNRPADRDGVLPTARAGARLDLGGGFAWRSAAYVGFRPATLNELHRPFRVGNNVTESNPALEPEKLFGAETGLDYRSGGLTASATLFVNRLKGAITNVTIGVGPGTFPIAGFIPAGGVLRQRQNAGAIDATGLEAEAEQRLTDALSLTGSLAWTHSTVDGGSQAPQLDGKRPALTPRVTATAGLRWHITPTVTAALDGRYESARYDDDLNTLRLRPAFTADLRADWRVRPGLGLYAAVDNLSSAHVQTAEAADGTYSYDAPRVVRVGVRLTR
jgi:outer membrane receptor protein involved in Fe transport